LGWEWGAGMAVLDGIRKSQWLDIFIKGARKRGNFKFNIGVLEEY
jgi:hypothetical protein